MDSLLPFRALSPGTRKPKTTLRNRDTKLTLKSHKVTTASRGNKENHAPSTASSAVIRQTIDKHVPRILDSDLMTSDESASSEFSGKQSATHNSVMSLNTQESVYSLPVAESTRCDPPPNYVSRHKESTVATLRTAESGSSSSTSSEYHTACPGVGCDESIVCISDSSPESTKQTAKKTAVCRESVLLSSDDDSVSASRTKYLHQIVTSRVGKREPMKLCDTVVLETSDSDIGSCLGHEDICGLIIPPSVRGHSDDSASSSNSVPGENLNDFLVVPPSPPNLSESSEVADSLISEDGVVRGKSLTNGGTTQSTINSNISNTVFKTNAAINKDAANFRKEPEVCMGNKLEDSSWKDDFHLVMQDLSEDHIKDASCVQTPKKTVSMISKQKYNDIERWLFSGKDSPENNEVSSVVDSGGKVDTKLEAPRTLQHPQISRLSIVQRSSQDSESDDNFDALCASTRKKLFGTDKESFQKNISAPKEGSFIDDSSSSDAIESSPSNIYLKSQTQSIRAEAKSVQKLAKSFKRRQIFKHLSESEEETSKDVKTRSVRGVPKVNMRRRAPTIQSEDSSSESCSSQNGKGKTPSGNLISRPVDSLTTERKLTCSESGSACDSEDNISGPSNTCVRGKSGQNSKPKKSKPPNQNLDSDSSDSEAPINSRRPKWRDVKVSLSDSDSSSTTSSSGFNVKKNRPKNFVKPKLPKKQISKPAKVQDRLHPVPVTPKKIMSLKSPCTPYSPIRTFLSSLSGPTHEPGIRDHPEAAVYNKNFKSKKEELTRRLFKLFNREVFDRRLPDDMVLEWNARLVRTAGLCYCKLVRKQNVSSRTAKISLSTKVITSPDRLRDTLIHEMCHSAVWLLNNISGGHGPFWKAWAQKAMKRFPELPPIERCHSYNIEFKFTYKCSKCGYSFGRHSKSLDTDKKRCGYCYGKFEVFLTSKGQNSRGNALQTPRAPSAFALFVKEKYGIVKQANGHLQHGDVMKKLGEMFASFKLKQA